MRGSLTPPSSCFPGLSVAAGIPFTTRLDPPHFGTFPLCCRPSVLDYRPACPSFCQLPYRFFPSRCGGSAAVLGCL